jgi:hypothetical protein
MRLVKSPEAEASGVPSGLKANAWAYTAFLWLAAKVNVQLAAHTVPPPSRLRALSQQKREPVQSTDRAPETGPRCSVPAAGHSWAHATYADESVSRYGGTRSPLARRFVTPSAPYPSFLPKGEGPTETLSLGVSSALEQLIDGEPQCEAFVAFVRG